MQWYETRFGEDYLRFHQRSAEQAKAEIRKIGRLIPLRKGDSVLDVGCGTGEHCLALAEAGCRVIGIDLSQTMIDRAKAKAKAGGLPAEFFCQDMRAIHLTSRFDAVFNLFGTFGYFETDEENQQVLTQMRKAMKNGGWYVLDCVSPAFVRRGFVPYIEREASGVTMIEKRRIEGERLEKEIQIHDGDDVRHYRESIRLYSLEWLEKALKKSGLWIREVYGDYDESDYNPLSSPRILITGKIRLTSLWR